MRKSVHSSSSSFFYCIHFFMSYKDTSHSLVIHIKTTSTSLDSLSATLSHANQIMMMILCYFTRQRYIFTSSLCLYDDGIS